ncbi:hypothetical protein B0H19DRAFT_1182091 [Mycena capillaripes]|nr:hypothetical protein B0H19DRAFT_1182091 [Mycena capillaripes]
MEATLPCELERQIFEIAGFDHFGMIPTLLRVARRVHVWMEPLLYRVIWLDAGTHAAKTDAVYAAISSKPASFFKDAVRHLFIDESKSLDKEKAFTLLRLCANVVNLAVLGDLVGPPLLPILARIRLRRLSISLEQLFGGPQAVDFCHPLSLSVTHLDIFGNLAMTMCTHLIALPALTHLCLNGRIEWDIVRLCLSECKTLVLLVNLWPSTQFIDADVFAAAVPFEDARFVVGRCDEYWRHWEASAEGGADFWSEAAAFVAEKRRGEFSGTWLVPLAKLQRLISPSN